MGLRVQDVDVADVLRFRILPLMAAASTPSTGRKAVGTVCGLPDSGGTVTKVHGSAVVAPSGTATTTLILDVHKVRAGTDATIFTTTKVTFADGAYSASSTDITAANGKVYNGDVLTLDVDGVGTTVSGTGVSATILIRMDEAND